MSGPTLADCRPLPIRSFQEHVCARRAVGAIEYRDKSYMRPLAELLVEQLEEAADLAAWGEIATAVLAARTDLTPAQRSTVARAIKAAQAQGRWAWERLHGALRTIEEKEAESG